MLWKGVATVSVVGVDIAGKQWCTRSSQWSGCVARTLEHQLAISILQQPDPSGTKVVDCPVGKFFFENINRTEGAL
jgi:hypothetical protein